MGAPREFCGDMGKLAAVAMGGLAPRLVRCSYPLTVAFSSAWSTEALLLRTVALILDGTTSQCELVSMLDGTTSQCATRVAMSQLSFSNCMWM
jgi:hypothetical protein